MSSQAYSQIAATPFLINLTCKQQFTAVHLGLWIITMVFWLTLSSAKGNPVAECPARCSCSTLVSYVNSRAVKCSYLDLSDTPAVLNVSTVHTLDLSNNKISILRNASFSSYSRLSVLMVSYNEVNDIEINAFAGLRMMRDIDLGYNNLESFNPVIFSSNPVLEKVSLTGNPLVYLSSDSPILISDSISSLDLSSCSLTAVPEVTFSRLPGLYSLDISSNLIQTVSVSTFEKLPGLRILKMNNNRWTCSCDVVEVMKWATARSVQQPAHKPVRCLERQLYRKLWTPAGGSKSCSEFETTEALVTYKREFTTGITENLPTVSVGSLQSLDSLQHTTSQGFVATEVISVAENTPAPESEDSRWASLLSGNVNTLWVFVILPITLGGAVFVSLIAVNCVTKRFRSPQHVIQGKDNHLAAFFSDVPLLDPKLTADLAKQRPGCVSSSNGGFCHADYHVYEEIA